ncbi:MAG TPA: hypothetical protein DCP10_01315 [Bacteroidales bacterium]|nr:hypothetical protein [Bacteroidales bacterium]
MLHLIHPWLYFTVKNISWKEQEQHQWESWLNPKPAIGGSRLKCGNYLLFQNNRYICPKSLTMI